MLVGLLTYLGMRFGLDRTSVASPQPAEGLRAGELADRLDPNTATAAEIAAIPSVGEKLARAIVEDREDYLKRHPGERAFTKASDLLRVKGVGAAKVELLMGYFILSGKPATTRAAR